MSSGRPLPVSKELWLLCCITCASHQCYCSVGLDAGHSSHPCPKESSSWVIGGSAPGEDPAWECPLASCTPTADAAQSGAGCACRDRHRNPACTQASKSADCSRGCTRDSVLHAISLLNMSEIPGASCQLCLMLRSAGSAAGRSMSCAYALRAARELTAHVSCSRVPWKHWGADAEGLHRHALTVLQDLC